MHNNKIKIFSFFSGAGFLDLGFETEGCEVVFVNEVHKPFLDAYIHSRNKLNIPTPQFGYHNCNVSDFLAEKSIDLKKYIALVQNDKNITGFIGGPPCPDFSVAGKNRGEHGENGILSQIYIDIICEQLPDFFIFENVKGLYRTSKHKIFFNKLKEKLISYGYVLTERLINAIEYGVPQDRERIILIGTKKQNFKEKIEKFDWISEAKYPNGIAFDFVWPTCDTNTSSFPPVSVPLELTVQHWFEKNEVSNHPNSKHFFQPRAGLKKFLTVLEGDDSKKSYKRLHRWRYSPTAAYGNNEVHIHPYLPRRLSAAEALAIQSLPKNFELPDNMTLTNMFKTIGNGVPFLAAQGVARSTINFFSGK